MTFSTSLKVSPVSSLESLGLTQGEVELVRGEIEAFLGFHQSQGANVVITDITLGTAPYILGTKISSPYAIENISVVGGKSLCGYPIPLLGRREVFVHVNGKTRGQISWKSGEQGNFPDKVANLLK